MSPPVVLIVAQQLTAKGRLQARQTAAHLAALHLDAIYASPLRRARETAECLAAAHGLPVLLLEALREVNVGILEEQPPTMENWALYNRVVGGWHAGAPDIALPGGENYWSLLERMRAALLEATRGRDGQTLALVGHGGIFNETLPDICPGLDARLLLSNTHNCSITELALETHEDTATCIGRLVRWADCSHLSGEAANFISGNPGLPSRT